MKIMDVAVSPELGYCLECDKPSLVIYIRFKNWPHKISLCKKCLDMILRKFNIAEENGSRRAE